jgi:hypothetical protein
MRARLAELNIAAGQAQLNPDHKWRALVAMARRRIDDHLAADDPVVEVFQPRHQFAHPCFYCWRGWHMAKSNS